MACNVTLTGIPYDCGVNLSGVKRVLVSDWNKVTAVTVASSEITAITMAASSHFYEYIPAKNTGSLTKTSTKKLNVDDNTIEEIKTLPKEEEHNNKLINKSFELLLDGEGYPTTSITITIKSLFYEEVYEQKNHKRTWIIQTSC